ncbi:MAG: hypothetical protein NHG36_09395, partial [Chromatiaceae bacterium]|nr:hypothetical protein [Candidatus Thioaporhodococcus sediminis]
LVEGGVIERQVALLAPDALGSGVLTAIVEVTLEAQSAAALEAFEALARAEPAVQQCQQVEQQAVMTVEQMSQDEKYPYFNEVREDMADIIELGARKGVYISLSEAYNKAIRMNDGTFQASSVRDQSQGATQAALEAHRAAQAAKGASVSVTGSPTGTGKNSGDPSNLRGLIENAFGGGRL